MRLQRKFDRTAGARVTRTASRPRAAFKSAGLAASVSVAAVAALGLSVALAGPASAGTNAHHNVADTARHRPTPTPTPTLTPTPTPAPTPTSTPPPAGSKTLGISDPDLILKSPAVQASQLAAMKAMGITSIRLDADWGYTQPTSSATFDWADLDQVVKSIRAAGMSVDLIIDGCPQWAAVPGTSGDIFPQPASPAQFATWAADVAARYAPQGVGIFEIWNEPNIQEFWQPKPNPAAYTADLKAAYASIKSVDPSAFVISGGLSPQVTNSADYDPTDFLTAMYANGAKGSFDAIGYHPYSYPALPNSLDPWSAWSQMGRTRPSLRSVMTRHGDDAKQIWITEFGAPTSGPDGVGQAGQATALTQAIADAKSTGWIGALYIYSWQDQGTNPGRDEDWFGLLTAGGREGGLLGVLVARGFPKRAYAAVAAAIGTRRCGCDPISW